MANTTCMHGGVERGERADEVPLGAEPLERLCHWFEYREARAITPRSAAMSGSSACVEILTTKRKQNIEIVIAGLAAGAEELSDAVASVSPAAASACADAASACACRRACAASLCGLGIAPSQFAVQGALP